MQPMSAQELDEAAAELDRLAGEGSRAAELRATLADQVTLFGFKSYHLRGKVFDLFYRNGKLVIERHEPEPQDAA